MKNNAYIEKVLSHISGKKQKKQIEYELSDHMVEKEKWYTELEYDPDTAAVRAEEDMGDPDTTGEELATIHIGRDKKSGWIAALMLILPLLGFVMVFLFTESGEPPYSAFGLYHILFFPLLCFMLAEMIYSFRKQRILPLILSSVVSTLIMCSEKFAVLLMTTGRDIGKYVLSDYNDYMETDTYIIDLLLTDNGVSRSIINCARIILPVVAVIYAVVSLVIIIKNKKLKNRRYDYYIGRGMRFFLSVFAAVILISFSVQSFRLLTFKETYTQSVADIISERNRKVIEAVHDYLENGSLDFSDLSNELDLTDNPYCCTHAGEDGPVFRTYAAGFDNLLNGGITFAPFEKESADSMIEFVRSGGRYIEDAPLCCELTFDGEDRIVLSCYTDYYGLNRLAFDYIDGRFELADTQLCTKPDIKLSDEQVKQFYDAYRASRTDIDEHLLSVKDPRYEFHIFSKIFGVAYNDNDDMYTIYFDYRPLGFTEIDGKLYIDEDEDYYSAADWSAYFRFTDGKAEIIDCEKDISTGDYGMYRDINLKGLKKLDDWRNLTKPYPELDGQRLKLFERTNSVEKFAKRCFISAPLTGLITYTADGTYSLRDFDAGDDMFGDVIKDNYKCIR